MALTACKLLARNKSYNSALSMGIINKINWNRADNKWSKIYRHCSFCKNSYQWRGDKLWYYTSPKKDNRYYLFCEDCGASIEDDIEAFYLTYLTLEKMKIIIHDCVSNIKKFYMKLYFNHDELPKRLIFNINYSLNLLCKMDNTRITHENIIELADELNICTEARNVWNIISDLLNERNKRKTFIRNQMTDVKLANIIGKFPL